MITIHNSMAKFCKSNFDTRVPFYGEAPGGKQGIFILLMNNGDDFYLFISTNGSISTLSINIEISNIQPIDLEITFKNSGVS